LRRQKRRCTPPFWMGSSQLPKRRCRKRRQRYQAHLQCWTQVSAMRICASREWHLTCRDLTSISAITRIWRGSAASRQTLGSGPVSTPYPPPTKRFAKRFQPMPALRNYPSSPCCGWPVPIYWPWAEWLARTTAPINRSRLLPSAWKPWHLPFKPKERWSGRRTSNLFSLVDRHFLRLLTRLILLMLQIIKCAWAKANPAYSIPTHTLWVLSIVEVTSGQIALKVSKALFSYTNQIRFK